jgi:hypothetical protein
MIKLLAQLRRQVNGRPLGASSKEVWRSSPAPNFRETISPTPMRTVPLTAAGLSSLPTTLSSLASTPSSAGEPPRPDA